MTKKILFSTLLISSFFFYSSCNNANELENNAGSNTHSDIDATSVSIPTFNEHAAYNNIAQQVNFGPRVPNTKAQLECAEWLEQQLKSSCDTVYRQETIVTAGDGKTQLRCINLIGVINPKATKRILLLAHWDTRPWADKDNVNQNSPIDGADDGGSGVGVLLEIANVIATYPLPDEDLGIDILFADVEDYGKSEWGDKSYALGTRYWANNPHVSGYTAQAGILLDMVGGYNAYFPLEGYSKHYAPTLQREIWATAGKAGYSSYFVFQDGPSITDDHVPVNEILKIPTIDIINLPPSSETGFVAHWHTHNDNLSAIDKNTLKAVGQTLVHYLYTVAAKQ